MFKIFWQRAKDLKVLFVLAICSLWGSIQSSIPAWYIDMPWTKDTLHGVTTIIQGISFSFFSAWLFYIFQDIVPKVQHRIDAIRNYKAAIRSIDDNFSKIELSAFGNKSGIPESYDENDMFKTILETDTSYMESIRKELDKWGLPSQIPLSIRLTFAFTISVQGIIHSIIKQIDATLQEALEINGVERSNLI